jgi:hypothetical protein
MPPRDPSVELLLQEGDPLRGAGSRDDLIGRGGDFAVWKIWIVLLDRGEGAIEQRNQSAHECFSLLDFESIDAPLARDGAEKAAQDRGTR